MAKWEGKSFPQTRRKKVVESKPIPESEAAARKQQAEQIRSELRYDIDSSLAKRIGPAERIKK